MELLNVAPLAIENGLYVLATVCLIALPFLLIALVWQLLGHVANGITKAIRFALTVVDALLRIALLGGIIAYVIVSYM